MRGQGLMEADANGYTGRTGIQYLNARSNTSDKRELRRYRARHVTISGRPFGQRARGVPLCRRECVCIQGVQFYRTIKKCIASLNKKKFISNFIILLRNREKSALFT